MKFTEFFERVIGKRLTAMVFLGSLGFYLALKNIQNLEAILGYLLMLGGWYIGNNTYLKSKNGKPT